MRKQLAFLLPFLLPLVLQAQGLRPAPGDSTVRRAAGAQYKRSALHHLLFGKHYREVWAEPVEVGVLDLGTAFGGLKPLQMGGSFQTKNLRLSDSLGREFVLRSVDKNPTVGMSPFWRKTFLAKLAQDQTSVIHPYGYYLIPTLSEAAGVYYTNPRLVFIPDDPRLGEFRSEFRNMLAMLEERPQGERDDVESFGTAGNIYSSRKAFREIFARPDHQVDAKHYLRSRLFDIWLGDWSRREDQWRWNAVRDDSVTYYRPIPRDRDHAFFLLSDGVFPWVLTRFNHKFPSFRKRVNSLDGYLHTAAPMDRNYLVFLSEKDFVDAAETMRNALTDDVLQKALSYWPENIKQSTGNEFVQKLQSRREQLPEIAREFYRELSEEPGVTGSDDPDLFLIKCQLNGDVKVQLFSLGTKKKPKRLLGERLFKRKETEQLRLFGLGGDDEFRITGGEGKRGIKIHVYGGEGEDIMIGSATAKGNGKRTRLYDEGDGNRIEPGEKAKVISYQPKANQFNSTGWLLRHRLH